MTCQLGETRTVGRRSDRDACTGEYNELTGASGPLQLGWQDERFGEMHRGYSIQVMIGRAHSACRRSRRIVTSSATCSFSYPAPRDRDGAPLLGCRAPRTLGGALGSRPRDRSRGRRPDNGRAGPGGDGARQLGARSPPLRIRPRNRPRDRPDRPDVSANKRPDGPPGSKAMESPVDAAPCSEHRCGRAPPLAKEPVKSGGLIRGNSGHHILPGASQRR